MSREPSPAPRLGARLLALLSGKTNRVSAPDELTGTRPALAHSGLRSRRDSRADAQRREPVSFDAFRGFRDPASPNA